VQHPGTYEWDVNLTSYVAKLAVRFEAVAVDPGSDDLTFEWDFGDNSTIQNSTVFNDGVGPDPPKSPGGTFPFTATAEFGHSFPGPGTYTVTLTVRDDDGGSSTAIMTITIL
jgi:PKD repeat protein